MPKETVALVLSTGQDNNLELVFLDNVITASRVASAKGAKASASRKQVFLG